MMTVFAENCTIMPWYEIYSWELLWDVFIVLWCTWMKHIELMEEVKTGQPKMFLGSVKVLKLMQISQTAFILVMKKRPSVFCCQKLICMLTWRASCNVPRNAYHVWKLINMVICVCARRLHNECNSYPQDDGGLFGGMERFTDYLYFIRKTFQGYVNNHI